MAMHSVGNGAVTYDLLAASTAAGMGRYEGSSRD